MVVDVLVNLVVDVTTVPVVTVIRDLCAVRIEVHRDDCRSTARGLRLSDLLGGGRCQFEIVPPVENVPVVGRFDVSQAV